MGFGIRWSKVRDEECPFYCIGCGEQVREAFIITRRSEIYYTTLCLGCVQALHSTLSPLSILVLTGKDTSNEKCEI